MCSSDLILLPVLDLREQLEAWAREGPPTHIISYFWTFEPSCSFGLPGHELAGIQAEDALGGASLGPALAGHHLGVPAVHELESAVGARPLKQDFQARFAHVDHAGGNFPPGLGNPVR